VARAILRAAPSTSAQVITTVDQGETVCVLARVSDQPDWYLVDAVPRTRFIDTAYIFADLVEAQDPTPTPSATPTTPPSITPTATATVTPTPTRTPAGTG
jgi:hypothetical protein